jgi:hypothetical protein
MMMVWCVMGELFSATKYVVRCATGVVGVAMGVRWVCVRV